MVTRRPLFAAALSKALRKVRSSAWRPTMELRPRAERTCHRVRAGVSISSNVTTGSETPRTITVPNGVASMKPLASSNVANVSMIFPGAASSSMRAARCTLLPTAS
jgi:hypothetical protein